jgi:hypothetical protein
MAQDVRHVADAGDVRGMGTGPAMACHYGQQIIRTGSQKGCDIFWRRKHQRRLSNSAPPVVGHAPALPRLQGDAVQNDGDRDGMSEAGEEPMAHQRLLQARMLVIDTDIDDRVADRSAPSCCYSRRRIRWPTSPCASTHPVDR